ncbi:A/G-specific adenine glycosylase [Austwickia chelonae]|uniref:A/G-specific adenine glycosylase n=1 Tax=Austwickia chelonae TaxID=100225 RepID=UPI0013C364E5|nr:A/G-specific adenine glycosylase [Austwickia chelonae]
MDFSATRHDILHWYDRHARDLPWRQPDRTPWGVFVSEVMLQQTPVNRVEPAWHAWTERWPTPAALAADPAGEAVRMWNRLGYPRRALRLHAAATAMVEHHDSQVPDTEELLRALPGVGAYTAAAVAAFAFGRRATVVDTNIRRVHARLVTGSALPQPSLTRAESALADELLPQETTTSVRWNVACMELGALVCTARAPRCSSCPVQARCAWQRAGCPPYTGKAHRGQAWEGTDRQARGTLMAVARAASGPVGADDLRAAWPRDDLQRNRCLASLVADGLLVLTPDDRYSLP